MGFPVGSNSDEEGVVGLLQPPIIDISCYVELKKMKLRLKSHNNEEEEEERERLKRQVEDVVATKVYEACSTWGGFLVVGHGVSRELQDEVYGYAKRFFSLPLESKMALHVKHGGLAWRGYMPIGGERTHGQLDHKEGLYLGPDHDQDHPKVKSPTPLFGRNQLPDDELPGIRVSLLRYIEEVTELGQTLMELLALSLRLEDDQYIRRHFTKDPIALVRLFNYPAREDESNWGIGEHTDYGLWTMLKQFAPGLQIEHPTIPNEWVDVPLIDDAFFCNVGDVLDRMTDGRFKSPKHRARNYRPSSSASTSASDNSNDTKKEVEYDSRISIPFFFDPSWEAEMMQLPLSHLPPCKDEVEKQRRWDTTSIVKFEGPYSQFLAKKVSKVFPRVLPESVVSTLQSTKQHSTRFAIHDIS